LDVFRHNFCWNMP